MYGEVFMSITYQFFFEQPLWQYHLLPIHHSYTSIYSLFIWGLYGFHLSLFHSFLIKNGIVHTGYLSLIMSFEAVLLEIIFNGSFLLLF